MHDPAFDSEDYPRGERRNALNSSSEDAILAWLERSLAGKQLLGQLREVCKSYTLPGQMSLIRAATQTPSVKLSPATLSEKLQAFVGRESTRQRSLRELIERSAIELEAAGATNQDIDTRVRLIVNQFVEENFERSSKLQDILDQIDYHLDLFEEQRRQWDDFDRQATDLAGGGFVVVCPTEFAKLPEYTKQQVKEVMERARLEYEAQVIMQAGRVTDWDPLPSKFNYFSLRSKDGELTLPLDVDCRDLMLAFRSVAIVGAFFLRQEDRCSDGDMEYQIKYDILLGAMNQMKGKLVEAQTLLFNVIKDVAECMIGQLHPKLTSA